MVIDMGCACLSPPQIVLLVYSGGGGEDTKYQGLVRNGIALVPFGRVVVDVVVG